MKTQAKNWWVGVITNQKKAFARAKREAYYNELVRDNEAYLDTLDYYALQHELSYYEYLSSLEEKKYLPEEELV